MTDSILLCTKEQLEICDDYNAFDPIIITHINSVFMILDQLGVSVEPGFQITGETETWEDYLKGRKGLNLVKSYMYLKVRLLFDPPNVGVLHEAMERQIAEFEWRLNAQVDPGEEVDSAGKEGDECDEYECI